MNKTVNFRELVKSSDVVSYYPCISAQEAKQTSKQSRQFTNLNCFIWEQKSFNQNQKEKKKQKTTQKKRKIIKKLINMIMAAIIVMVIITKIKTN